MRRASKVDQTHAEIRECLRGIPGWQVFDTSALGEFVDLVACCGQHVYLIECKTPLSKAGRVKMTASQDKLIDRGFPIVVLTSAKEAMAWALVRR